ncbi:MAG: hypothetical protein L0287_33005 [Anaerolineae bacterium]|nr:hypothetical protein [Anaerolineae bacterium]
MTTTLSEGIGCLPWELTDAEKEARITLLKEKILALRDALTSGASQIRFRERDITFRSIKDIRDALAILEEELRCLLGVGAVRQINFQTSKGL